MRKKESLEATSETDIEGADVTCWDRLFQVRAAATGKVYGYYKLPDQLKTIISNKTFGVRLNQYYLQSI